MTWEFNNSYMLFGGTPNTMWCSPFGNFSQFFNPIARMINPFGSLFNFNPMSTMSNSFVNIFNNPMSIFSGGFSNPFGANQFGGSLFTPISPPMFMGGNSFGMNQFTPMSAPTPPIFNPQIPGFGQGLMGGNMFNMLNNIGSGAGQQLLNYANQFVGKTQNEMRGIMKGAGYAFHTNLWCADFVSYISGNAVGEANLPAWYKQCNRSSCVSIDKAARQNGAIVADCSNGFANIANVKPGDFIIFDWKNRPGDTNHIGFVERISGNTVYTLEGNAGGKVSRKTRSLSEVHSFIRI